MMELFIELHDHAGVVHNQFQSKFGNESTLDQLKEKIHSKWNIDNEDQTLFFEDGRKLIGLGEKSIQSFGLKHGDKVIVKHTLLPNWSAYLEEVEEIKRLTTSGATSRRKRIAIQGRRQLSHLDDSDFFTIYPNLDKKRRMIDGEINFLVHNTAKYLKRSIEKYFEAYEVEIVEKPKKAAGVHLGFFVKVTDKSSGICRKFYAKTVGALPELAEFAPDEKPKIDLIELFVYQLLSLIGFGASEVHIVPDSTNSDCVYLSTSLIQGFRTASGYLVDELLTNPKASEKETVISKEVQNQLNIIASILFLIDLRDNKGNYGVVERQPTNEERQAGADDPIQELKIVDFRADLAQGPRLPKTTTTTSLESYFGKWKLKQKIGEAKQLIMENKAIKSTSNLNIPQLDFYVTQIEAILETIK